MTPLADISAETFDTFVRKLKKAGKAERISDTAWTSDGSSESSASEEEVLSDNPSTVQPQESGLSNEESETRVDVEASEMGQDGHNGTAEAEEGSISGMTGSDQQDEGIHANAGEAQITQSHDATASNSDSKRMEGPDQQDEDVHANAAGPQKVQLREIAASPSFSKLKESLADHNLPEALPSTTPTSFHSDSPSNTAEDTKSESTPDIAEESATLDVAVHPLQGVSSEPSQSPAVLEAPDSATPSQDGHSVSPDSKDESESHRLESEIQKFPETSTRHLIHDAEGLEASSVPELDAERLALFEGQNSGGSQDSKHQGQQASKLVNGHEGDREESPHAHVSDSITASVARETSSAITASMERCQALPNQANDSISPIAPESQSEAEDEKAASFESVVQEVSTTTKANAHEHRSQPTEADQLPQVLMEIGSVAGNEVFGQAALPKTPAAESTVQDSANNAVDAHDLRLPQDENGEEEEELPKVNNLSNSSTKTPDTPRNSSNDAAYAAPENNMTSLTARLWSFAEKTEKHAPNWVSKLWLGRVYVACVALARPSMHILYEASSGVDPWALPKTHFHHPPEWLPLPTLLRGPYVAIVFLAPPFQLTFYDHFWRYCWLSWTFSRELRDTGNIQLQESDTPHCRAEEIENGQSGPEAQERDEKLEQLKDYLDKMSWTWVGITAIIAVVSISTIIGCCYFYIRRPDLLPFPQWCWNVVTHVCPDPPPPNSTELMFNAPTLCAALLDSVDDAVGIHDTLLVAWNLSSLNGTFAESHPALNLAFTTAVNAYDGVDDHVAIERRNDALGLHNFLDTFAQSFAQTKRRLSRYDERIGSNDGVEMELLRLIFPTNATMRPVEASTEKMPASLTSFSTLPLSNIAGLQPPVEKQLLDMLQRDDMPDSLLEKTAVLANGTSAALDMWTCWSRCVLKALDIIVSLRREDGELERELCSLSPLSDEWSA